MVVLAAWNRREGKIIREALLQADRVNVGIPLQDPVQGQGKDLVDLCLRPGVLIVLQSAYKGVERDAAGADGGVQGAHDLNLVARDAELLAGLSDRCLAGGLALLNPAAGKADLSGLGLELRGPHFIEDMIAAIADQDRDQDGGAAPGEGTALAGLRLRDPGPQVVCGRRLSGICGRSLVSICHKVLLPSSLVILSDP